MRSKKRIEYEKGYYKKNKSKILKQCEKYRIKHNERNREWRKNHPEQVRAKNLMKKYNLTLTQYKMMLEKQENRCAICGIHQSEVKVNFSIDHNHRTGQIRGLLCSSCNTALGFLKDSIETAENLIKYLIRWNN